MSIVLLYNLTMYDKIIAFVKAEGDKLMEFAGTVTDNHDGKKWTTKFDHQIEEGLKDLIETFAGKHFLYSEEIYSVYEKRESAWIADPISHTINFIHGMPHFAVVVAHLEKGEVVFSCIYDPSNKELFSAYKGKGAFLNGKKIEVTTREKSTNMILYNMFPVGNWTLEENLKLYKKISHLGYIESFASFGLNYAYIAAGRAQGLVMCNKDTFPEFAGKLLIEEAGGILTDFKGKELEVESRGIIAGTPQMHEDILKLLQ